MRNISIIFFVLFIVILSCSRTEQHNKGTSTDWEGSLKVNEFELKLIFKLNNNGCLLDIPIQAVQDYPSSNYEIVGDSIKITFTFSGMMEASFVGINQKDTAIVGNWEQMGKTYPISLKRKKHSITFYILHPNRNDNI